VRRNDKRVRRTRAGRGYVYYFGKHENEIVLNNTSSDTNDKRTSKKSNSNAYTERDLHILLSSYLWNDDTYSKTIFHVKSQNSKDDHQKWVHPDMIGIRFLTLQNKSSNALLKVINKSDAFDIISYELKRAIRSDYDLKKCFFQAVSNSSWANHGFLVAFEISDNVLDEMARLSQSFGIGIIQLGADPFESQVLFPSRHHDLDFKTIDKLCQINQDFAKFIAQTEMVLAADEKYVKAARKEFESFCDPYFKTDSDIKKYCEKRNIPYAKS